MNGAESRAKMARMHVGRSWKYDAAHGSRLPHGTKYENYARKPDIAGHNNFNIYEAEIFQCLFSALVCLGGGHRTLSKKQLYALDVLSRKPFRSVVTPPSDTDWSLEWHEILITGTIGPPVFLFTACAQNGFALWRAGIDH